MYGAGTQLLQGGHEDRRAGPAVAQRFLRSFQKILLNLLLPRTLNEIELARRRLVLRVFENADRPFDAVRHEEPLMNPLSQLFLDLVEPFERIGREADAGQDEGRNQCPALGREVLYSYRAQGRSDFGTGTYEQAVQQEQRDHVGNARLPVGRFQEQVAKWIDRPRQSFLVGKGGVVEAFPGKRHDDQQAEQEEDGPVMRKHNVHSSQGSHQEMLAACCTSGDLKRVSIPAMTSSSTAWRVSRQCIVSVASNCPVSNSLFAGAPPPHQRKYRQLRSHASTPRRISPRMVWNRAACAMSASECVRTLPKAKSPNRG